jgi:hypothetical protein
VIGIVLIALTLAAGNAFGQDPLQSWTNLQQLRSGQTVQIVDMKLKSVTGKFSTVSADSISIRRDQQEFVFKRDDISRISVQERLRKSLVLGSVGAVVGFGLGAVVDYLDDVDRTDPGSNNGKLSATGVGFGIGFGIGAAFPGQRTIYRAKPTNVNIK